MGLPKSAAQRLSKDLTGPHEEHSRVGLPKSAAQRLSKDLIGPARGALRVGLPKSAAQRLRRRSGRRCLKCDKEAEGRKESSKPKERDRSPSPERHPGWESCRSKRR